jgi:hypothetical protein
MDDRSFHVLLDIQRSMGELKSDVRSHHEMLAKHILEDDELTERVSVLEKAGFKITVVKGLGIACFSTAWTVATWLWAAHVLAK